MNAIFYWICNPVAIFIVILIISAIFHFLKKERKALLFFSVGIGWVVLVSTTPFPQWIVHSLEMQYPVFDSRQTSVKTPAYILVLGGGHTPDPDLPASMKLSGTASARLVEGLRIYHLIPGSKLVGSGNSVTRRITLAEIQSIAAIELGVEDADTLQSRQPKNTAEEIQAYKKRFGTEGSLILVTSAIHMPRAMFLCKKYGLTAIPAPADYFLKKDPMKSRYDFKPSARKMEMMEWALHEYAGMIKAKWLD